MKNLFIDKFNTYPHEYFFNNEILEAVDNYFVFDLFNVFCSIYYADIMIKNTNVSKSEGRDIDVLIPVYNIKIWEENKSLIQELARFMSQDNWNIMYDNATYDIKFKNRKSKNNYSSVTLISGGLDSFCGGYFNISKKTRTIYCGYKLNTYEQHFQEKVLGFLLKIDNTKSMLCNKIDIAKREHTQRTRSLLFLSIACVVAQAYNINIISLYENGIMSLNPELYSRKTTKTTHPKSIYLYNKILESLGINIRVEHPFLFKTKGEIINNLPVEYRKIIKYTYTCGTSRVNPNYNSKCHCGVCIPCTLRKISIAAYDLESYDREYEIPYGLKICHAKENQIEEYKSSNEYYKLFKEKIDNHEIFNYLDIRNKYYFNSNYLELTKNMLELFSREIEIYYKKYPIF